MTGLRELRAVIQITKGEEKTSNEGSLRADDFQEHEVVTGRFLLAALKPI